MIGIDYSFARPGGAAIKAAGFDFACRYLASSAGKRISADEVTDLKNNGVDLVLVFEDDASQAIKGTAQGTADGQEAGSQADAIGFPKDRPLYYAVDTQVGDNYLQAIDDYLRAAEAASGRRSGVYGDYTVVQHCLASGSAGYGWQTLAWSGGKQLPNAHLYQNGSNTFGGGADIDNALQTDFGQWGYTVSMNPLHDEIYNVYETLDGRAPTDNELAVYEGKPWTAGDGLLYGKILVAYKNAAAALAQTIQDKNTDDAIAEARRQELLAIAALVNNANPDDPNLVQQIKAALAKVDTTTKPTPLPSTLPIPKPTQSFWDKLRAWLHL